MKRIPSIPVTAAAISADDYLMLDGITSGTRKFLAASVIYSSTPVSTNGLLARVAANTYAARVMAGTANEISVANGDGVAGNPTLSLPTALTFTGKTVTGGTFISGAFNGTVGATTPSTGAFTTLNAAGAATFQNDVNLNRAAGTNFLYYNSDLSISKNGTGAALTIDALRNVSIPSGTLSVAGNMGVGGSPLSQVGIYQQGSVTASSGTAQGISTSTTLVAAANSDILLGFNSAVTGLTGGAFTGLSYRGISVGTPAINTGTIANAYQLYISAAPTATTKYGIFQAGSDPNVIGGTLALPDGTVGVATGALYFSNDTNTGFYRAGADTIGFMGNGASLGTWSPTSLAVTGIFSATGEARFGSTAGSGRDLCIGSGTDTDMVIRSSAALSAAGSMTLYLGNAASDDEAWVSYNNASRTMTLRAGGTTMASLTSAGLTVTGAINASGVITSTVTSGLYFNSASVTTGANYQRLQGNGGTSYFGTEDSTGATFSADAYAFFIYSAAGRNINLMPGGAKIATVSSAGLTMSNALGAGEIRLQQLPGTPYTQAALTIYRDASNWGYINYGSDANMRIVFGKSGAGTLYLGTTTAADNTGTFTSSVGFNASLASFATPVSVTGTILATSANARIGYATGGSAGGAVTQATSRTTGVTLNTPTGAITLFTAAGSATATSFTVTNSSVAATDIVALSVKSGTNKYLAFVTAVAAGSFEVTFYTTGGVASDAPVINYAVIKGSAN